MVFQVQSKMSWDVSGPVQDVLGVSVGVSGPVQDVLYASGPVQDVLGCFRSSSRCPVCFRSRDGPLLACDVFRTFWVSWEEAGAVTTVTLGLGSQVGSDVYETTVLDKVLDVNHVSVASYLTTLGTWVFGQCPGTCPTHAPHMPHTCPTHAPRVPHTSWSRHGHAAPTSHITVPFSRQMECLIHAPRIPHTCPTRHGHITVTLHARHT